MNISEEISLLFNILNKKNCLKKFPLEVRRINILIYHHGHYNELHDTTTRLIRNSLPKITKPRIFIEVYLVNPMFIPGYMTPLFYTTLEDLIKCLGFQNLLNLIDLNIELK